MKYQFLKEHPHSLEVQHPDGSTFHVAKAGLNPDMLERIKLTNPVKLADGGEVGDDEEDDAPAPEAPKEEAPAAPDVAVPGQAPQAATPVSEDLAKQVAAIGGQPEQENQQSGLQTTAELEAANAKPQERVYGEKQAPKPEPGGSLLQQYQSAYGQQQKGIEAKYGAQAAGLNAQAEFLKQNAIDQKKAIDGLYLQREQNVTRRAAIEKSIREQPTNAIGMFSNKTTAQQIGTALSVILGGIGAGLSGKPNQALEVVNQGIERDIQAQRLELGKKENLLAQNLREYGDLNVAIGHTRLDMQAAAQGSLQALAAKSGSDQAKAEANIVGGQLKAQQLAGEGPLAMQQMGIEAMRNMQNGGPVNRQALEMLPQFKGKTVALTDGKVGVASTPEGAKKTTEIQIAADDLKSTLNRMANFEKEQKVGGTVGAHIPFVGDVGSANYHLAKALQAEAFAKINHLAGINRMSDVDLQEVLMKQIPDPGSMNGAMVRSKIAEMTKNIDSKLDAYYKNNLLNYSGASGFKAKEGPAKLGTK